MEECLDSLSFSSNKDSKEIDFPTNWFCGLSDFSSPRVGKIGLVQEAAEELPVSSQDSS